LAKEEVIWEDLEIMNLQFLEVDLGDKEVLEGGGNDQDQERYLKNAYNRVRGLRQKQAEISSSRSVDAHSLRKEGWQES
jgi:hypothetical protein